MKFLEQIKEKIIFELSDKTMKLNCMALFGIDLIFAYLKIPVHIVLPPKLLFLLSSPIVEWSLTTISTLIVASLLYFVQKAIIDLGIKHIHKKLKLRSWKRKREKLKKLLVKK